jgi:hypothetical protein
MQVDVKVTPQANFPTILPGGSTFSFAINATNKYATDVTNLVIALNPSGTGSLSRVSASNLPFGVSLTTEAPWLITAPVFPAASTVSFNLVLTAGQLGTLAVEAVGTGIANGVSAAFVGLPYTTPQLSIVSTPPVQYTSMHMRRFALAVRFLKSDVSNVSMTLSFPIRIETASVFAS